jgi:hypothetical protein
MLYPEIIHQGASGSTTGSDAIHRVLIDCELCQEEGAFRGGPVTGSLPATHFPVDIFNALTITHVSVNADQIVRILNPLADGFSGVSPYRERSPGPKNEVPDQGAYPSRGSSDTCNYRLPRIFRWQPDLPRSIRNLARFGMPKLGCALRSVSSRSCLPARFPSTPMRKVHRLSVTWSTLRVWPFSLLVMEWLQWSNRQRLRALLSGERYNGSEKFLGSERCIQSCRREAIVRMRSKSRDAQMRGALPVLARR